MIKMKKKYKVSTSKKNLQLLNHYNLKHVRLKEDRIEFITDSETFEKIKDILDLNYLDLTTTAFRQLFKKHLITIIGAILIFLALVNQSVSIVEVRFTNPDTFDQEVVDYLDRYYRRVGPFSYLNENLNTINFDLRSEFYQYEWIGIRKRGAVLYLDIKKLVNPPKVEDDAPGSYYAKYDGIIQRYHIERGVVVVQEEQYVSRGELLISGDIVHYNNEIEKVRAKGYVIAEVLQYKDYTIKKSQSEVKRSGKMEIVKDYYLFGIKISKDKSDFDSFDVEAGKDTNFFDIIKTKKYYRYETKEIKNTYNSNQAVEYAKSFVYKEFRNSKINEFEKIIFNNLVKIEEDDNYYYVRLIVKSYQNIAVFVKD